MSDMDRYEIVGLLKQHYPLAGDDVHETVVDILTGKKPRGTMQGDMGPMHPSTNRKTERGIIRKGSKHGF